MLHWPDIDTVLLDMDGTLLDLAFDNRFWLEVVPARYAADNCMSVADARAALTPQFRTYEATLNWYCIDHWSRELSLDIAALKLAEAAHIGWLPGARDFLVKLRYRGKRLVLLTNAHPETLRIKDERTGVAKLVHKAYSSHSFGAPKEDPRFWAAVSEVEKFDPERTLFVDDNPTVLRAAREAGIRWLYAIRRPDSTRAPRDHAEFPSVDAIADLLRD